MLVGLGLPTRKPPITTVIVSNHGTSMGQSRKGNGSLPPNFFVDSLGENSAAIPVQAESMLVACQGDQTVISAANLELEFYANLGHCELEPLIEPRPLAKRYWGGEDCDCLDTRFDQVVWQVRWRDRDLRVVHLEWSGGCGTESRDWIIADSAELADDFILDVARKTHMPGDSILVFSDGCWSRSQSLYAATQAATFDDLVLAGDLQKTIRNDFAYFLNAEERYNKLGIAWRRGAIMIGPPGNGKPQPPQYPAGHRCMRG